MARKRGKGGGGDRKSTKAVQKESGSGHVKKEEMVSDAVPVNGNDGEVASSSSKSQSKSGRGTKKDKALVIPLRARENLTREDVKCPICWSMLMQPTTLPCNHSMCLPCFEKHIEENSLCCPCCRLRVAVWTRSTKKQGKLLDEGLWKRLKREFPKLVEARMLGMDTQNIMDTDADPTAQAHQLDEENNSFETSTSSSTMDGTLTEAGEVKREYDLLYEQHAKDLELERLREEAASVSLIRQMEEEENQRLSQEREKMEEEDHKLAQKIQRDLEAQEIPATSWFAKTRSSRRNLTQSWVESSSNNDDTLNRSVSPDMCQSSKNKNRKTSESKKPNASISSKTIKKRKQPKSQSKLKSDGRRKSQDRMSDYLMSQNSQSLLENDADESYDALEASDIRNEPCSSCSIPRCENQFSAFSPTKASNRCNIAIPSTSTLAVPVSSYLEDSTCSVSQSSKVSSEESTSCSSRTPDSIKSEVDRHFRPIKSAPKTPPRRRPDGTFLPEPKLIKMTPLKAPTPSKASAYILSPSKQVFPAFDVAPKPSCATAEKRISNDSGRASESPNEEFALRSLNSAKCGMGMTTNILELQPDQNDRGCSSDDYRVTPEDVYSKDKRKSYDDKQRAVEESPFKKVKNGKIKLEPLESRPVVKTEVQPLQFECSQGVIVIDDEDEDYIQIEAEELERLKMKKEQEAADLAFALKLQKDLRVQDQRENFQSRGKERYSLRSCKPGPSSSSRPKRMRSKNTTK